jgi:hypothetical protein
VNKRNNKINYALEKLGLAIYELTVGEGDIKSRLRKAYRHMSALSESNFPEDLKKDWNSIKNRLTQRASEYKDTPYDEGSFKATMFRMHRKTASKIAADIVDFHSCLEGFIKDSYEDS